MTATGKCLCGAVRFEADDVEAHIHSCHCGMCRSWSGGPLLAAGVGSVRFEGEEKITRRPLLAAGVGSVRFEGEEKITRYQSSAWAERGFCSACGSNLFYRLKEADQYVMCTGAFDDESAFELAGEIYIDEKPPGYGFAGDHPRQTGEEFLASLKLS